MIKRVKEEELLTLNSNMKKFFFAGKNIERENFGLDKENEFIVEYSGNIRRNRESLFRVLSANNKEFFYVVLLEKNADTWKLKTGYEIYNDTTDSEFQERGTEIGYTITGSDVIVFDDSFSWCIMADVEWSYIVGNDKFFSSYYNTEKDKLQEIKWAYGYMDDLYDKEMAVELKNLIRYKVDGKWCNELPKDINFLP